MPPWGSFPPLLLARGREPQPSRELPARFEQRRIRRAGGHGAGGGSARCPGWSLAAGSSHPGGATQESGVPIGQSLRPRWSSWSARPPSAARARSGRSCCSPRRAPESRLHPRRALRRDDAELSEVAPQSVDQHRSLANQEIPGLVQHQHSLLHLGLHGHEPHGRPCNGLGDCLSVGGVGLAALHIGLHVRWRHETHLVADRHQLTRPMVGRGARFVADEAGADRPGRSPRPGRVAVAAS